MQNADELIKQCRGLTGRVLLFFYFSCQKILDRNQPGLLPWDKQLEDLSNDGSKFRSTMSFLMQIQLDLEFDSS